VSFATFCEILNRAVVTLHGWLKVSSIRDGPQVLSCACDVEVPQKAPRSVALHFAGSSRDAFLALAQDLREMAGSAQKGYSLRNKALEGGVIVVFFRQNSVSIGELLQGMEQQLFGNENEQ
jgi:hypothetical protein